MYFRELAIGKLVNDALVLLELPRFKHIEKGTTVLTERGTLATILCTGTFLIESEQLKLLLKYAEQKGDEVQKIKAVQYYFDVEYEER